MTAGTTGTGEPLELSRTSDEQTLTPRGLEPRLDQRLTDPAASKRRRHLRVHEYQGVPPALVGEDGHLPVDHELKPPPFPVVCDAVIRGRIYSEPGSGSNRVGRRITRGECLLEGLIRQVVWTLPLMFVRS
jgi:hypothetical protein